MSTVVATAKPPKNTAAGQYLGYALQPVRLCSHLLRSPDGAVISLENVDDIAVLASNGRLTLEQCKSALKSNPVADKSVELWKTFATWTKLASAGSIDPAKTDFRLYVTPGNTGPIVEKLDAASNSKAITPILADLKKWLTPAKAGKGCHPYLAEFLGVGDAMCVQIISNFRIIREDDPLESIREALRVSVPTQSLDDFCKSAIGHAKEEADELLRNGRPAKIAAKSFRDAFRAWVRKFSLGGLLNSTTTRPHSEDIKTIVNSSPLFVRQLQLVNAGPDLLMEAASDFLRTTADKTNWAEAGEIVAGSFDEFDEGLRKHFTLVRSEIEDVQSSSAEDLRGRNTYRRCIGLTLPLEGRVVPTYFVPGAFNILADGLRVGWHPSYSKLLGGD